MSSARRYAFEDMGENYLAGVVVQDLPAIRAANADKREPTRERGKITAIEREPAREQNIIAGKRLDVKRVEAEVLTAGAILEISCFIMRHH